MRYRGGRYPLLCHLERILHLLCFKLVYNCIRIEFPIRVSVPLDLDEPTCKYSVLRSMKMLMKNHFLF